MSMFKKFAPALIVSSILLSPAAFAVNQGATVTFEAMVRTASCTVSSTTEGAMVNWGVFTTQDLASVSPGSQLGVTKDFNLMLTECSAESKEGDSVVHVNASGLASAYNPDLFANSSAKSLAVKLEATSADNTQVDVKPNKEASVSIVDGLKEDGFALIPMKASLIMVNQAKAGDNLKVPVTFTVSYN